MKKLLFFVLVFLVGCASHIYPAKVEKKSATLEKVNNIDNLPQQPFTDKVIAIVAPEIHFIKDEDKSTFDIDDIFTKTLKSKLSVYMISDIEELLLKKGFKIKGPYDSFDEITYEDKKKTYLAFVPKVYLYIKKETKDRYCAMNYCFERGVLKISGNVKIILEEPLTKQIFMVRNIKIQSFSQEYEYGSPFVFNLNSQNSLNQIGSLNQRNIPLQKRVVVDNTQKVLADLLNKFYHSFVSQMIKYIDKEEILSYAADIKHLKAQKRY